MLTARATSILWLCIGSLAVSTAAWADGPVRVGGDNNGGWIDTTIDVPGTRTSAQTSGASNSSTNHDAIKCTWVEAPEDWQSLWEWYSVAEPGGTWYDIHCSDGAVYFGVYVPPGSGSVPPEVRLAGVLARTVVNRLQLPQPRVGQSPVGRTLVGLPTWWWVEPTSWQVLRQRTTSGPVWAEVTATPMSTTWDPGDGSESLTCAGPGTAYDRARPESAQATDCSYTYRRSSAEQPQTGPDVNDRFFTVTVTTTWQVTWRGSGGSGGTLPVLTRSSAFPLAVAQRQTVVTGGSG